MDKRDSIKHLPFYKELSYDDLLFVDGLLDRDASPAVIYLWYNITHGMYSVTQILDNDKEYYKAQYPKFANDIDQWQPNSQNK